MELLTAELPMLALILVMKLRPAEEEEAAREPRRGGGG